MQKYVSHSFLILILLVGCSRQVPVLKKLAPLPVQGNCRIGVLPFLDETPFPQGAAIVGKVFLSELVATDYFQVLQEGDIMEIYRQLLIYPNQLPNREQLEMIGGRLKVDLIVGGVLQKMHEQRTGTFVETELTLLILLYHGRSGELLWITYHHRLGSEYQQLMHLGRINTVTGLARRMSQEIITDWLKQGMTPCIE